MSTVVPAILEKSKAGFLAKESILRQLVGLSRIQVDFADGVFVANNTLEVDELDSLSPAYNWEAHLMVSEASNFLDYQICGFTTILVHYEAYSDPLKLVNALSEIKKLNIKPGLVLNPETPISVCLNFKELVDHFLVMAVKPGFQGSPFIDATYSKISELRSLFPHATIEVDGGVNLTNIKKLKDAGADLLAVGSGLFASPNPPETFQKLSDEIK